MKNLAIIAALGLSISVVAAEEPAAGRQSSNVSFSVFALTNTQSIPVKVTLEAPAGKVVYGPVEVAANGVASIDPKATNVESVRVVGGLRSGPRQVGADGHARWQRATPCTSRR
jgi:hypothetical protein